MTGHSTTLLLALLLSAHADTLILRDGTRVTGRWWACDASQIHFLVNNQLQQYPRSDVSAVTFGSETVAPAPPAPTQPSGSAPPPAPTQPSGSAPPPAPTQPSGSPPVPPAPAQPSGSAPPPAPAQPSGSAPPPAPAQPSGSVHLPPARSRAEPEEVGLVYFRNDSGDLIPLERTEATAQRHGAAQYWEMPAPRSPVRLKVAPSLQFVVRLAKGIDPDSFSLFPLATVNGSRRTKPDPKRKNAPLMVSFEIAKAGESTYSLTVRDLAPGEYAFSPESSNDGYCFGVDTAATGANQ